MAPPPKARNNFQSASNPLNPSPAIQKIKEQQLRNSLPTRGPAFLFPTASYLTETLPRLRSQVRAACTGLRNTPTPATETSTVSPPESVPTPAGVPVAITSPGIKVIIREIQRTRNSTGYAISEVFPDCRLCPFTNVSTRALRASTSVSMCGPIGQNVSKLFARVNCTSLFCRSRAVTSFRQVYPSTYVNGFSDSPRFAHFLAMITASSPSYSIRLEYFVSTIASPGPTTDEGAFKNIIGSCGISLPSSAACAA